MAEDFTDAPVVAKKPPRNVLRPILTILFVVVFLGVGLWGARYMMANRPTATRQRPPQMARLVEVQLLQPQSHLVIVEALGTVVPAHRVELAARVTGEVVEVADRLMPGDRLAQGETILTIDPADYELAVADQQANLRKVDAEVAQRQSDLRQRDVDIILAEIEISRSKSALAARQSDIVTADSNIRLERGERSLAEQEFALLGVEVAESDRELVLRQPQLLSAQARYDAAVSAREMAEAQIRAAESARSMAEARKEAAEAALLAAQASQAVAAVALQRAELNLSRTSVKAPFDALVQSRDAWLGTQVSAGRTLATLVSTEEYWVQVSVPVDHLRWLQVPGYNTTGPGSQAEIVDETAWRDGQRRSGVIRGLLTELERQGRLAQLLVAVKEPLSNTPEAPPLILGTYVSVTLQGATLENAIRVPRQMVHGGNTVWEMNGDDQLAIRPLTIAWSDRNAVYTLDDLPPGTRLVSSDISTPVEGMNLRLRTPPPAKAQDADVPTEANAVPPLSGNRGS